MVKKKYFWTDEQLTQAVDECKCRTEVSRVLCPDAEPKVLYLRLVKDIARLRLNTSHWQGSGRGGVKRRRSVGQLFVVYSNTNRSVIRRRILQANLLPYKCRICDTYQWNGKPISLHVDHISGNRTDNRLSNLRLLCPNCHSQTSTYAGKRENHSTNRAMCDILKAIERTHGVTIANKLRETL